MRLLKGIKSLLKDVIIACDYIATEPDKTEVIVQCYVLNPINNIVAKIIHWKVSAIRWCLKLLPRYRDK